MLIQETKIDIQSNLDSDSIDFSIDEQSIAFIIQMLSSRMYSKPVTAMIRETVTNAYDANSEAGLPHIPISISVTKGNSNDLGIYTITDSGNGMSPDCVKNILTKLGKSTKSGSNDSHGGFGLGILSVFAVSSQATIITIADGILYHYLMFLNDKGIPAINLITQREARKHEKGTKVEVPFDFKLETEIYAAVCWFAATVDPQPLVQYSVVERPANLHCTVLQRESYQLRSARTQGYANVNPLHQITTSQILVKIGEVTYRLNDDFLSRLRSTTESALARTICSYSLSAGSYEFHSYTNNPACGDYFVLQVPVGKLTLPGSREDILNTPENLQVIKEVFDYAVADLQSYIVEYLQSSTLSLSDRVSLSQTYNLTTVTYNEYSIPTSAFYRGITSKRLVQKNSSNTLEDIRVTPISVLDGSGVYTVISDKTRGIASSVNKLVGYNRDSYCYWVYKTEEDYQAILDDKSSVLSLILSQSTLLVDNIKTTRAKSLSPEQKLQIRLRQLTNDDCIKFIPNIRVLALNPDIKAFQVSNLLDLASYIGTEAFIHIENRSELLRAAYICDELDIDVSCWLATSKVAGIIKMLDASVESFGLHQYLQNIVVERMESELSSVAALGHFPFHQYSIYTAKLQRSKKALQWVLNNSSVLHIADSYTLETLRKYNEDYTLWSYVLEIDSIKVLLCRKLREINSNFNTDSNDGHTTISKIFSSQLNLLPTFSSRYDSSLTVYTDNPERLNNLDKTLKSLVYLDTMPVDTSTI